jgi:hypothetical protein
MGGADVRKVTAMDKRTAATIHLMLVVIVILAVLLH